MPLALALVACCAMACGTVYAVERLRSWRSETWAARRATEALTRADAAIDALKKASERMQAMEDYALSLRAEVDSLRASAAFRSM
jgi:hypothetical protein